MISQSKRKNRALVVDLDNLLHRGQSGALGKAQGALNLYSLAKLLKEYGIDRGTVCKNWDFSNIANAVWANLGLQTKAVNENCDQTVIEIAHRYADEGDLRELVIAAGDGDYVPLVHSLKARGIRVSVWGRRANMSAKLVAAADAVRFIDKLMIDERMNSSLTTNARQSSVGNQPELRRSHPYTGNRGSEFRVRAP